MTQEQLFEVLRKKLHYLEGFADALENVPLQRLVSDTRSLLNRFEKENQTVPDSTNTER